MENALFIYPTENLFNAKVSGELMIIQFIKSDDSSLGNMVLIASKHFSRLVRSKSK